MNILQKNRTINFEDSDLIKVKLSGKDLPITKNLKITNVKDKISGKILIDKIKNENSDIDYLENQDTSLSDLDHLLNQNDNLNFDKVFNKKDLLNQRLKIRNKIDSSLNDSTKKNQLKKNVINLKKQEQALMNLRDNLKNKIILRDSNQLNSDLLNSEVGINGPIPIGIPSAMPFKNIKIPINDNVFKSDENINIIANKVANLQNNPILVKPSITLIKAFPVNNGQNTVPNQNTNNSTSIPQNDTLSAILKQQNNQQMNIQNQQNMLINLSNKISELPKLFNSNKTLINSSLENHTNESKNNTNINNNDNNSTNTVNLTHQYSNSTNIQQNITKDSNATDKNNTIDNKEKRKIPMRITDNELNKKFESDDTDELDSDDLNFLNLKEHKKSKLLISNTKSHKFISNLKEKIHNRNSLKDNNTIFHQKFRGRKKIKSNNNQNEDLIENLKKGLINLDSQVNSIKQSYLKEM